jgi:sensor c-di-GMP phosphodiesterase-like protein
MTISALDKGSRAMTNKKMVVLVVGVLIFSVLLPITLSVWLAHYQAEKEFTHDLNHYGERVILHTQQVVSQAKSTLKEIDAFKGKPCSEAHLQAMRRASYTHRDVQEVLWLDGLKPLCSSLESKSSEMQFPPTDRHTVDGYRVWLTNNNDLGIHHHMVALASKNHMVMLDPGSFVDVTPFSSWIINVALVGSRSGGIIAQSAPFDLRLLRQVRHSGNNTFLRDGILYNLRDYPDVGISQVVWAPIAPLTARWHQQLLIWLPLGVLISLLSALLILKLVRQSQSPYQRMLDAINARSLDVYYQPIVSLRSGKIVGAEALARWRQPDGTFLSPDIFVPLAEQTGLITRLTGLIVEKVFEDLGPWLKLHRDLHVSINLDPQDLVSPKLPALLAQQLNKWGVQPSQVALELTERSFIDLKNSRSALSQFRQAGYALYIDDFGTGYSSLSYLQNLDVDIIKIDKSFVDALEFKNVTPHIIEMAKSLQLAIVAEGVETEFQRQWLADHGVQLGQGWLFSKALPRAEFILWAESNLHQPDAR